MSFQPLTSRNSVHANVHPDAAPKVLARTASDVRRRQMLMILVIFLATGFVAVVVTRASAQGPYKSIPMHSALLDENGQENEALIKRVQAATKAYVTAGKVEGMNMARGYYLAYVPAKMTGPDCLMHINPLVSEANTYLDRAYRSNRPQIAAKLTEFIFTGMKPVAEGNHHPSARIAAAILLSRLDSRPADNQNRTPAIPYMKSYPVLRDLYKDPNNSDGLRAAALKGLHRLARYGLVITPNADAEKAALIAQMTALLESDPPQGRSPEVHAYLQHFAIDIIDALRPTDDAQLGVKLVSISTKPSSPDLIALYSASRLGSMSKELKGKVTEPEQILESWSKRALDAFQTELARLEGLERAAPARDQPRKPEDFLQKPVEKKRTRSMMGGMMGEEMEDFGDMESSYEDMSGMMDEMDDMGDMMMEMGMGMYGSRTVAEAKPQPPQVRASRRKLNHVLQQLHRGVSGVAAVGVPSSAPGGLLASVDPAKKPLVVQWLTKMEPIVTALNDSMLDDQVKFEDALRSQIELLQELVGEEDNAALPDELALIEEAVNPNAPAAPQVVPAGGQAAPAGAQGAAVAAQPAVDASLTPQPADATSP